MSEPIAETVHGKVRGASLPGGILSFKGIRYAASPAAALRFAPPGPVEPWSGIRDAVAYAPSCPQPSQRPAGRSQEDVEDEDCLALNVWSPAIGDPARRPE